MAELHVQKKETNIWPWIIGVLVLAAVLWYAFGRDDTRNTVTQSSADSAYQTPPPGTPANPNPTTP